MATETKTYTVQFKEGKNSSVICTTFRKIAFASKAGPKPQVGDIWEVEVAGQNHSGSVYFLKLLRCVSTAQGRQAEHDVMRAEHAQNKEARSSLEPEILQTLKTAEEANALADIMSAGSFVLVSGETCVVEPWRVSNKPHETGLELSFQINVSIEGKDGSSQRVGEGESEIFTFTIAWGDLKLKSWYQHNLGIVIAETPLGEQSFNYLGYASDIKNIKWVRRDADFLSLKNRGNENASQAKLEIRFTQRFNNLERELVLTAYTLSILRRKTGLTYQDKNLHKLSLDDRRDQNFAKCTDTIWHYLPPVPEMEMAWLESVMQSIENNAQAVQGIDLYRFRDHSEFETVDPETGEAVSTLESDDPRNLLRDKRVLGSLIRTFESLGLGGVCYSPLTNTYLVRGELAPTFEGLDTGELVKVEPLSAEEALAAMWTSSQINAPSQEEIAYLVNETIEVEFPVVNRDWGEGKGVTAQIETVILKEPIVSVLSDGQEVVKKYAYKLTLPGSEPLERRTYRKYTFENFSGWKHDEENLQVLYRSDPVMSSELTWSGAAEPLVFESGEKYDHLPYGNVWHEGEIEVTLRWVEGYHKYWGVTWDPGLSDEEETMLKLGAYLGLYRKATEHHVVFSGYNYYNPDTKEPEGYVVLVDGHIQEFNPDTLKIIKRSGTYSNKAGTHQITTTPDDQQIVLAVERYQEYDWPVVWSDDGRIGENVLSIFPEDVLEALKALDKEN